MIKIEHHGRGKVARNRRIEFVVAFRAGPRNSQLVGQTALAMDRSVFRCWRKSFHVSCFFPSEAQTEVLEVTESSETESQHYTPCIRMEFTNETGKRWKQTRGPLMAGCAGVRVRDGLWTEYTAYKVKTANPVGLVWDAPRTICFLSHARRQMYTWTWVLDDQVGEGINATPEQRGACKTEAPRASSITGGWHCSPRVINLNAIFEKPELETKEASLIRKARAQEGTAGGESVAHGPYIH